MSYFISTALQGVVPLWWWGCDIKKVLNSQAALAPLEACEATTQTITQTFIRYHLQSQGHSPEAIETSVGPLFEQRVQRQNDFKAVKKELQELAAKNGFEGNLKFFEASKPDSFAESLGGNILFDSCMWDYPIEVVRCIFRHEICHTINHDSILAPLTGLVVSTISSYFLSQAAPWYVSIPANLVVGGLAWLGYTRFCEERADAFSIEHSSPEELEVQKQFLISELEKHPEQKEAGLLRQYFSTHPPLPERIKKIEQRLGSSSAQP